MNEERKESKSRSTMSFRSRISLEKKMRRDNATKPRSSAGFIIDYYHYLFVFTLRGETSSDNRGYEEA